MSLDHKPELEVERGRILFAGGFVHAGRVNGSLNLTRAIGMLHFYTNMRFALIDLWQLLAGIFWMYSGHE